MFATIFFTVALWSSYKWVKWAVMVMSSAGCLGCFIVSTIFVLGLQSAIQKVIQSGLPLIVAVDEGPAGKYSVGAMCVAVVIFGCTVAFRAT